MEKYYPVLQRMALPVVCTLLLTGCVKDDCKHTHKIYTPVYKTLTQLRAEIQNQSARALENPGKIYLMGNQVYLNEKGQGIHVIDNTNPRQPINKAFINIPGNIDIAMKENILYADMHCDLTAIDVTNTGKATVKKYLTNTFPSEAAYTTRTNPDSINIIVDWKSRDTVLSCDSYNYLSSCLNCNVFFSAPQAASASGTGTTGVAGSMARFATVGDYLYATDQFTMNIVNISTAANPMFLKRQYLGMQAETVYPCKDKLFIGSPTGMGVFSIQDPTTLAPVSFAGHWRNCDPVIADDKYAYVTIYSGAVCGRGTLNELDVYDITDLLKPVLVKAYPLTNPHGLSKDGNLLFICDGADGLKVFDATDVLHIKQVAKIGGIETYDVITQNGIAYVVAKDGLYQYDYSNAPSVSLLSKLKWGASTK